MKFHNRGYGRIAELIQPLIDRETWRDKPQWRDWVSERHWINVGELIEALEHYEENMPVCILGFSAYKYIDIVRRSPTLNGYPSLKIRVSCMPDFKFKGPGTVTYRVNQNGIIEDGKGDGSTELEMVFQSPKFADRVERLDKYQCGTTVGQLLQSLRKTDSNETICVSDSSDFEIIRIKQDTYEVDEPPVVELEIADVEGEREYEIFRYR